MSRSARTVAPLVGLKYCDLNKGEVEIDTDLYFEAAPQIKLNNHKREQIGGIGLDELTTSGWGFRHEYDSDPNVHLGDSEEASKQMLHQALFALWITRPSGADYSWFLNYHDRLGPEAISVWRFDSIHPLQTYENENISLDDLDELKRIWKGMRPMFSKNTLSLTMNHLYGALHLDRLEPRFLMLTVVLESLFTTSRDELSHRISERIALLLETQSADRKALYQKVRDIYKSRSIIAHGAPMKEKDIQKLHALAPELEYLVQRIMKSLTLDSTLFSALSGSQERRENFLNGLLFK